MSETIVAAAVRVPVGPTWREQVWNGERIYPDKLIVSSPPPARHHTLLHPLHDVGLSDLEFEDQGFLTSTGRYVERDEALRIALASGQPMIDRPGRHHLWLFSEDLW